MKEGYKLTTPRPPLPPGKTTLKKPSLIRVNNSPLCKPESSLTTNFSSFLFLLKTQNTATLQQVIGGKTLNLVLKKMLGLFLKIQENIRIPILDEPTETNKQKVLHFGANIRCWELKGEKCSKTFFKVLDGQNM